MSQKKLFLGVGTDHAHMQAVFDRLQFRTMEKLSLTDFDEAIRVLNEESVATLILWEPYKIDGQAKGTLVAQACANHQPEANIIVVNSERGSLIPALVGSCQVIRASGNARYEADEIVEFLHPPM